MFGCKYKIYLDNIYFDSLYGTDYYYDKSNFFAHGAKQFFTIYQLLRIGNFNFTIVEETSGDELKFNDSAEFKGWIKLNYDAFEKYLDNLYWDKHPDSKLKPD